MFSVFALRVVYCGFENYSFFKQKTIPLIFVASPHVIFRRKIKDWLNGMKDNVSEWGAMSTRGQLFQ